MKGFTSKRHARNHYHWEPKNIILSQTFSCILSNSNTVSSMVSREIKKDLNSLVRVFVPNCT